MTERDPATAIGVEAKTTEVGSVFVSNYPPYSFWSRDHLPRARQALDEAVHPERALGLYLHVPFCRKRCKFCYFKVYTDRNARDIQTYVDTVVREHELYAQHAAIAGRPLSFVYFGGGTPSYISAAHLRRLVGGLEAVKAWDRVEEVTFECEPGTLTRPKLEAIRKLGVTRLSLGIENFHDAILEENGRAHLSKEIYRVLPWIEALDFDQLNIDLISGMVGETWDTWRDNVRRAIDVDPDSVTIYQMELPFNTVYSRRVLDGKAVAVADWTTKREWHDHAIEELIRAGYEISSAYTMVKRDSGTRFAYRDSLWRGSDLLGIGVSSFSHVNGVHFQNESHWDGYLGRVASGELPIDRAYPPTPPELITRELILQLKLGRLDPSYFEEKFGVEILQQFGTAFDKLREMAMLTVEDGLVRLTRQGLLRVDQLLPEFYATRYQNARYT